MLVQLFGPLLDGTGTRKDILFHLTNQKKFSFESISELTLKFKVNQLSW